MKSTGGRVESFDFAFGSTDAYVIADLPDNATAAALALRVTAGGGTTVTTTALLTPDEIDQTANANVKYRPPGSCFSLSARARRALARTGEFGRNG